MEEKVFLQSTGIMVSSSRIEINGQTFATRNVGSVKVEIPGRSTAAILIGIVGVLALVGKSYIFGACALAVGIIWGYTSGQKRKLKLVAGGGEVVALESTNAAQVEQVRSAIAEAISTR